jgi:hypothetical protein
VLCGNTTAGHEATASCRKRASKGEIKPRKKGKNNIRGRKRKKCARYSSWTA